MCARAGIIAIALTTLCSAATHAQQSQPWTWCVNDAKEAPAVQIEGCTAVIQSGKESGRNLAIAFNDRGIGYHDRKEYDRAIRDYSEATNLDSRYARAYYNRPDIAEQWARYGVP